MDDIETKFGNSAFKGCSIMKTRKLHICLIFALLLSFLSSCSSQSRIYENEGYYQYNKSPFGVSYEEFVELEGLDAKLLTSESIESGLLVTANKVNFYGTSMVVQFLFGRGSEEENEKLGVVRAYYTSDNREEFMEIFKEVGEQLIADLGEPNAYYGGTTVLNEITSLTNIEVDEKYGLDWRLNHPNQLYPGLVNFYYQLNESSEYRLEIRIFKMELFH